MHRFGNDFSVNAKKCQGTKFRLTPFYFGLYNHTKYFLKINFLTIIVFFFFSIFLILFFVSFVSTPTLQKLSKLIEKSQQNHFRTKKSSRCFLFFFSLVLKVSGRIEIILMKKKSPFFSFLSLFPVSVSEIKNKKMKINSALISISHVW